MVQKIRENYGLANLNCFNRGQTRKRGKRERRGESRGNLPSPVVFSFDLGSAFARSYLLLYEPQTKDTPKITACYADHLKLGFLATRRLLVRRPARSCKAYRGSGDWELGGTLRSDKVGADENVAEK